VLLAMADALERPDLRANLLRANAADRADADAACARGELGRALVDRLVLDDKKLQGLCEGLRQLAGQVDPLGRILVDRELDDGLVLKRVTCPLGVLAVVFEARPDAVPQLVGLAVRSGNALLLKGGHEAARSNDALVGLLRGVLVDQGFDPAAIVLLEDRADVDTVLDLERDIDLVIARGSSAFVRHVQTRSRIPVLAHAEGVCHLFLHRSADIGKAVRIALDGKTAYPAACNAIETLLWDEGAEPALDACIAALTEQGVELRGCPDTLERHPDLELATESDFGHEFGALVLAVSRVPDLAGALRHIETYGSRHTEAIVAEDEGAAAEFLARVDAACVFHNASTRFADGYRFGLGAEVGISTSKLHARGPVGADGLVTTRWLLHGDGQIAADYGPGKRRFKHKDRG
jgi:glutamate-5-semialdehyde dehydrogenase